MRLTTIALGFAILLAPQVTRACGAQQSRALIRSAVPRQLPAGAIVAEVEIDAGDWRRLYAGGIPARVKRVIRGRTYAGQYLLLREPQRTSCDAPYRNGRSGILVGTIVAAVGDQLIVSPKLGR